MVTAKPIEDKNDEKLAYDRATELIKAYPNLKGIMGCSVSSTTMSGLVCQEKNKKNIAVAGLALPSVSGPYIESGFIREGFCWRPADAGYVTCLIAFKVLKGEDIKSGINLVKPGYENCTLKGNVVFGNAPLVLTKETVGKYTF
jgi:simple sugar transport system substrate-binding protein